MKKNTGFTLLELTVSTAVLLIVAGVVFISAGGNNSGYRTLQNAALTLQADLRFAQRTAVTEGRRVGIVFEPSQNRYQIITYNPITVVRTVNFQNGVTLISANYQDNRIMYLPRGTAVPGTIALQNGDLWQEITTTLSGGQARIHEIINLN